MTNMNQTTHTGWLPSEFVVAAAGGHEVVLDLTALFSNYQCTFGCGCDGVRSESPDASLGCCTEGPRMDTLTGDTPDRIQQYVDALTAEDSARVDEIQSDGWYFPNSLKVATEGGRCVFSNPSTHEHPGCSLYNLAQRTGLDPVDTRPMLCSTDPLMLSLLGRSNDISAPTGRRWLLTLRPGWAASQGDTYCTSKVNSFTATRPVWIAMRAQIALLMERQDLTDAVLAALDEAWAERGYRHQYSWGHPVTLPTPRLRTKKELDD